MTKKQLREKYDNWNVAISDKHCYRTDEIFTELQNLAYEVCGEKTCSLETNFREALKGEHAWRAMCLFEEYWEIQGAWDSMLEMAGSTENFKI